MLSKLEDGKAFETWYSFSKKKRKGSVKSKGYLKVKVMWLSAVVSTQHQSFSLIIDFLADEEQRLSDGKGKLCSDNFSELTVF